MVYTAMTKKAMEVCYQAHLGQRDKAGVPYVFHPVHLAEQMSDEKTTIVALLHDVIEDTALTADDLRSMGFEDEVIDAILCMTHDRSVPYLEYVAAIKRNPIARAVKIADLRHNSDLSRLNAVDNAALERVEKYKKALALLEA